MQVIKIILPRLAVYAPVVIITLASMAVVISFFWIFGPLPRWLSARRPARTWIVDQAEDLAGLERRLNYLEERDFKPHQVLAWSQPPFLIVAVRTWRGNSAAERRPQ
jgi:hypothetical protein